MQCASCTACGNSLIRLLLQHVKLGEVERQIQDVNKLTALLMSFPNDARLFMDVGMRSVLHCGECASLLDMTLLLYHTGNCLLYYSHKSVGYAN